SAHGHQYRSVADICQPPLCRARAALVAAVPPSRTLWALPAHAGTHGVTRSPPPRRQGGGRRRSVELLELLESIGVKTPEVSRSAWRRSRLESRRIPQPA